MNALDNKIAVIILAAGSSSRLGQQKQQVSYKGKTLLDNTIHVAIAAGLGEVVVVLGSNAAQIIRQKNEVKYVTNEDWTLGMGKSIAFGISQLGEDSQAAVIMLCDQPFVTTELIRKIADQGSRTKGVVVSDYGEDSGPPCYFDKKYFEELKTLSGDRGAKAIVSNAAKLVKIDFPKGKFDIDVPRDLKYLKT